MIGYLRFNLLERMGVRILRKLLKGSNNGMKKKAHARLHEYVTISNLTSYKDINNSICGPIIDYKIVIKID